MADWTIMHNPGEGQARRDLEARPFSPVCAPFERLAVSASNGALKRTRHRQSSAALLAFAVAMLLAGCSETSEEQEEVTGKAYGDTWVYTRTEITTQYRALFSPHGLFGVRHAYREKHVIRNSSGKTISIPDSLYALQRNGALRKVECCQYFRESGDLLDTDDKLVFIFDSTRRLITDCLIYPRGRPNNDLEPPENQADVKVFAEFDPKANIFKVATFDAGDNYLPFEYRAAVLRTGRQDLSIRDHAAFLYAKRKPFMCEEANLTPSALSAQPPYDDNAYQAGVTRMLKIAASPSATHSLVERLHAFAARKRWKAWQAGSVEKGDVSLAIQDEKILLVAAGDAAGLWRVAAYRRMAELPSERSVDALLHEVRSELEGLPGVSFRN